MVKKILVGGICLTLLVGLVLTPDVSAKRKAVEIRTWMYLDDAEEIEGHPWGTVAPLENPKRDEAEFIPEIKIIVIPTIRFSILIWFNQSVPSVSLPLEVENSN
jgi:hypothetical protein